MEHFGNNPLLSRVHPDLKIVQRKVVRHIKDTFNTSVQKVRFVKLSLVITITSFDLFQLKLPLLYHAMEMWSVKMTSAGNPPFVAELAMRKVTNNANQKYDQKRLTFWSTSRVKFHW